MLFRRASLILTIVLAIGAAGLALWFWKSENQLYSNPAAPRTNFPSWQMRRDFRASKAPTLPTNLFASITVEHATNDFQIWAPGPLSMPSEADYEPLTVHHANREEPIHIDGGTVRLAFIGTGYATSPKTNADWSFEIPATFYTPALRPVSREKTTSVIPDYEGMLGTQGDFPSARFYFTHSNLPPFKNMRFSAFDARTGVSLTQGYGYSSLTNVFWYQPTIRLWHQTPIELVVTIATGPSQTYTLPPQTGAHLIYPGGALKLLTASPIEFGGQGSRSDGRTNHITFRAAKPSRFHPGPNASFIFYGWPHGSLQGELEFYNHAGEKLKPHNSGSSGNILHLRVPGHPDDIKEIRFTHFPQLHRLIFTISELPGLPEENRHVQNLFDVRIPMMHFDYEYAFQDNLAQLLQMSHSTLPLTFSTSFPTTRTNITPRELFHELGSLFSDPDRRLTADPRKHSIEARPHPIPALIERLKKKLGIK